MIKITPDSAGREPTDSEIFAECVTEITSARVNPRSREAIRHVARILSALRHEHCGEGNDVTRACAATALDELRKLLEPAPVETPKPKKPRLKIFSGNATPIV